MAIVEAAVFTGLLAGTLSSSYILRWTNGTTVFAIAAGAVFLGLMYIIFYIEESIKPNELSETNNRARELFRLDLVSELMQTCFKRRYPVASSVRRRAVFVRAADAASVPIDAGHSDPVVLHCRLSSVLGAGRHDRDYSGRLQLPFRRYKRADAHHAHGLHGGLHDGRRTVGISGEQLHCGMVKRCRHLPDCQRADPAGDRVHRPLHRG